MIIFDQMGSVGSGLRWLLTHADWPTSNVGWIIANISTACFFAYMGITCYFAAIGDREMIELLETVFNALLDKVF